LLIVLSSLCFQGLTRGLSDGAGDAATIRTDATMEEV